MLHTIFLALEETLHRDVKQVLKLESLALQFTLLFSFIRVGSFKAFRTFSMMRS